MPGDKGAFILNTTTKEMEEAMGLLDGLKALVNRAFRKDGKDDRKETDMAEDGIEDRISAIEKKIEEVQAKIEALGAAVDELKGVNEGILQREKDLKWTEARCVWRRGWSTMRRRPRCGCCGRRIPRVCRARPYLSGQGSTGRGGHVHRQGRNQGQGRGPAGANAHPVHRGHRGGAVNGSWRSEE